MFSATQAWLLASILALLSCGLFVAASANAEEDELIIRDYLTNKPKILVEMTNKLDKRQVAAVGAAAKINLAKCRCDLPVAGFSRGRQPEWRCKRGRVL